jgi:hypothetical protein
LRRFATRIITIISWIYAQARVWVVQAPKYTGDGKGAKRNQGWNTEGLTEYWAICDLVAKDCKNYMATE